MSGGDGARALVIDGCSLTAGDTARAARARPGELELSLDPDARERMLASRRLVLEAVGRGDAIYGITTGFGALSHKPVAKGDLEALQLNLVRSHCAGAGDPFSREDARAIMAVRAHCLAAGRSGCDPRCAELVLDLMNADVVPPIPEKGSVGASGDLAPLAHLALCLVGEGECRLGGETLPAAEALRRIGRSPLKLGPKDGLALINGTAVMTALGALAVHDAEGLAKAADVAAAMTLDGTLGSLAPFDPRIHRLRPHPGQIESARNVAALLQGSEMLESHRDCGKVQDPYSLRCAPQVHGAFRQTLRHAARVVGTELDSVTDNPLVLAEDGEALSGGNFHGQCPALAMDYLAMGLCDLGNISERRTEKLMNPVFSGLPPFLAAEGGLNSGLMIAQVAAAALASENRGLARPASTDNASTSTDKEDHVSMGVTAGRKLREVVFNTGRILAIEVLCASQALHLRRPLRTSPALEACLAAVRSRVPPLDTDRVLKKDVDEIAALVEDGTLVRAAEERAGRLA